MKIIKKKQKEELLNNIARQNNLVDYSEELDSDEDY